MTPLSSRQKQQARALLNGFLHKTVMFTDAELESLASLLQLPVEPFTEVEVSQALNLPDIHVRGLRDYRYVANRMLEMRAKSDLHRQFRTDIEDALRSHPYGEALHNRVRDILKEYESKP